MIRLPSDAFERFFQISGDLMGLVRLSDGKFERANPAMSEVLGWSEAELEGMGPGELLHPDEVSEAAARLGRAGSATVPRGRSQFRMRCKDGQYRWVEWQGVPYQEAGLLFVYGRDVHEEKLLELALRRSEERLRIAQDATALGVFDFDILTGTIAWDRRLYELWDLPEGSMVDYSIFMNGLHPDDRESTQLAVQESMDPQGSGVYRAQYRVRGRWILAIGRSFFEDGRPVRMVGTVQDVTERHEAAQELIETARRFRSMFENAAVGMAHVSLDGMLVRVNQRLCEFLGYEEAELMRQSIEALTPEEDMRQDWGQAMRLLRGEIPHYSMEKRYRHRNGHLVWAQLTVALQRDEQGKPQQFISVVQDIEERKGAEAEQQRLREQLARSVDELQQVADSLPQLVWVSNREGLDEWHNQRWYEYTGVPSGASDGRGWEQLVHPQDLPEVLERWAFSLSTGTSYEAEFRLRRRDGAWRWFLGRAEPIVDENGAIQRWFGTATDIQDQKRTEEALRHSNQDLERFAYVASHDLQEPLRTVTTYSQLLQRQVGAELGEARGMYLRFIREGGERASRLVEDLLLFARTAAQQNDIVLPTDAKVAVQTALMNLQAPIKSTGAVIHVGELPTLPATEALLGQVFQNLLSNALKYHRPGVPPEVWIMAEQRAGEWIFSVRDNGQGIEEKYRGKVFELFARLHGNEVSGSGIGLATVKRVVERQGGRIWVESEVGMGSTFFFSLPVG